MEKGLTPTEPRANIHPTCKSTLLMRWLVKLACPVGGLVLDPFAGSGSTGVACLLEGRQFLGIEQEPEYAEIARLRIAEARRLALVEQASQTSNRDDVAGLTAVELVARLKQDAVGWRRPRPRWRPSSPARGAAR